MKFYLLGVYGSALTRFLSSARLAIVLLILILLASLAGEVFFSGPESKKVVYSSLWFNSLLGLLMLNVAFCFSRRIWSRRITLALSGLMVFHLSFISLSAGVIYDNLFFSQGTIKLTEGETLSLADEQNYEWIKKGRFFKKAKLKELGEIYFHELHLSYWAGGKFRGAANEFAVGEAAKRGKREVIYVNHPLGYKGFEFYQDKDGYSPLFVLYDRWGRELSGVYVPLNSVKQKDGTYLYSSGFQNPFLRIWTEYYPKKGERPAEVLFHVWQPSSHNPAEEKELFNGKAEMGEKVRIGDYYISMEAVRYWASIDVFHHPGSAIIVGSFWIGLGGLTLSVIVKMIKGREKEEGQDE